MTDIDERPELSKYYLVKDGDRVVVQPYMDGGEVLLAGPVMAGTWQDAKEMLRDEIRLHLKRAECDIPASILKQDPVFKSAHEALTFAFRFAGQQSPKTPMSVMMQTSHLGSGRGLSGLDGAGQAGMVLAALKHLKDDERHVLIARYGDVRRPCPCCGQPAPDQVWAEAVEALSLCDELHDLPKAVRHAAIEKSVCRRKLRFGEYVTEYGLSERTLRDKVRKVKDRYAKVENAALAWLGDFFQARGVLVKPDA